MVIAYGWNAIRQYSGQVVPVAPALFGISGVMELGRMTPFDVLGGITELGEAPGPPFYPGGRGLLLAGLYVLE